MHKTTKPYYILIILFFCLSNIVFSQDIKWERADRNLPILVDYPTIEPKNGTQPSDKFLLKFKTIVETPPARLSLRAIPRERDVNFHMGFDTFREKGASAKEHEIEIDTKHVHRGFQGRKMPANGGDIAYTLEIYDPQQSCAFLYEGVFRLVPDKGKFRQAPCIVEGPFITKVTSNSAEVFFTTDVPVKSSVSVTEFWGEAKSSYKESKEAKVHKIALKDLESGRKYKYSIEIDGVTYKKSPFRTAPTIDSINKFSFCYMGDSRMGAGSGHENFSGVNRKALENALIEAKRQDSRFVLFGGDLISGYSSSRFYMQLQLEQFKRTVGFIGHMIPLYPCVGNHEIYGETYKAEIGGTQYYLTKDSEGDDSSEALFASQFNNFEDSFPEPEKNSGIKGPSYRGTVYSFDYGNSHFAVMNTEYWYRLVRPNNADIINNALAAYGGGRNGYIMENQMSWLKNDLEKARKRGIKHIFIMFHEPVFPNSSHTQDSMFWGIKENGKWIGLNNKKLILGDVADMRERFLKVVSDNNVLAIVCAHEHGYNRLKIDNTLSKNAKNPIWQITSAGAGAPYATQDLTMPWADKVMNFSEDHNIVIFNINGDKAGFKVISSSGDILDQSEDLYKNR